MLPTQQGQIVPGSAQLVCIQRIGVIEGCARKICPAHEGVVHGLFVQIRVFGIMICEVHLPLEEDLAATRARFAIGVVPQRIIRAEAFRSFTAADAAGYVVLLVDDVDPERFDGALVIDVVGFHGDIRHPGVAVHGAHRMTHCLILLNDGQMALVVFLSFCYRAYERQSSRNFAS